MDIKNIIKNLHPLEIKVLLKYTAKDELTSEKLQKELDYKEGHANQAFSWLGGKELLKEIRRTPHTYYEITDMGKVLAKTGTVEERMVAYLRDNGPHALPEIAAALAIENKDIGSAFGPLSKEGVLKMNAEKKAEYTGAELPTRVTKASEIIKRGAAAADGILNKDDLSADEVEVISTLAKKRGAGDSPFKMIERETVTYKLTEAFAECAIILRIFRSPFDISEYTFVYTFLNRFTLYSSRIFLTTSILISSAAFFQTR